MEQNEEKVREQIRDLRSKLKPNPPDLTITRIPKSTLSDFKQIANHDDFCADYGMALKFLVDFYKGYFPTGLEELRHDLDLLKEEVEGLKRSIPEEEEQKEKKRLG